MRGLISTSQPFLTDVSSTSYLPHLLQNVGFADGIFLWVPALPLLFQSCTYGVLFCFFLERRKEYMSEPNFLSPKPKTPE